MIKRIIILSAVAILLACEIAFVNIGIGESLSKQLIPLFILNGCVFVLILFIDDLLLYSLAFASLPLYKYTKLNLEIGVVYLSIFNVIILILFCLKLYRLAIGSIKYRFSGLDIFIVLFFLTYGCTTLLNAKEVISPGFVLFHYCFIPSIAYFVTKTMVKRIEDYKFLLTMFATSMGIFAIIGLFNFIATSQRLDKLFQLSAISYAIMFAFVALHFFYSKHFRGTVFGVLAGINLLGLLLSLTRGVLFPFFLSPIFFFLFRRGWAKTIFASVVILSVCVSISLPLTISSTKIRITAPRDKKANTIERITNFKYVLHSLNNRLVGWKMGLEKAYEKPILGHGAESVVTSGWHNIFIEILYWSGLLGLFFTLLIFSFPALKSPSPSAFIDLYQVNLFMILLLVINGLTNGFHGLVPLFMFLIISFCECLRFMPYEKHIE